MTDIQLKALINKYVTLRVKTHKDVIKHTQISEKTYYRRLANPQKFTLEELRLIFDYLRIPADERTI